jgi:hypothetical protein
MLSGPMTPSLYISIFFTCPCVHHDCKTALPATCFPPSLGQAARILLLESVSEQHRGLPSLDCRRRLCLVGYSECVNKGPERSREHYFVLTPLTTVPGSITHSRPMITLGNMTTSPPIKQSSSTMILPPLNLPSLPLRTLASSLVSGPSP